MAAIALFGIVAYRALPVSDLPTVDFPTIQVRAGLPGGDPGSMAASVASPLERQFTTIAGVDSMISQSSMGNTQVTLQFDLGRPIDSAAVDVQTAIAEDELLTEVRLPGPRDDAGSAYASLEQPASGYAIVGVAAVVIRSAAKGPIGASAIAITGVGPVAYRASAVEKALAGSDGSAAAIAAAAAHATDGVTVNSDIHADREYRTEMARVFTVRAIEAALARLG